MNSLQLTPPHSNLRKGEAGNFHFTIQNHSLWPFVLFINSLSFQSCLSSPFWAQSSFSAEAYSLATARTSGCTGCLSMFPDQEGQGQGVWAGEPGRTCFLRKSWPDPLQAALSRKQEVIPGAGSARSSLMRPEHTQQRAIREQQGKGLQEEGWDVGDCHRAQGTPGLFQPASGPAPHQNRLQEENETSLQASLFTQGYRPISKEAFKINSLLPRSVPLLCLHPLKHKHTQYTNSHNMHATVHQIYTSMHAHSSNTHACMHTHKHTHTLVHIGFLSPWLRIPNVSKEFQTENTHSTPPAEGMPPFTLQLLYPNSLAHMDLPENNGFHSVSLP